MEELIEKTDKIEELRYYIKKSANYKKIKGECFKKVRLIMLINEFISKYDIIKIDDIITEAIKKGFNEDEIRNTISNLIDRKILIE